MKTKTTRHVTREQQEIFDKLAREFPVPDFSLDTPLRTLGSDWEEIIQLIEDAFNMPMMAAAVRFQTVADVVRHVDLRS